MDLGSIFLILALFILVGLFITRPLFDRSYSYANQVLEAHPDRPQQDGYDHNRSMLLAERDRILTALHELDFDHALGKIPEAEYPQQRMILLQKGANVLRELDSLVEMNPQSTVEDRLEAAIAARRADMTRGPQDENAAQPDSEEMVLEAESVSANAYNAADDELEVLLAKRKRSRQEKAAGFCPQCGSPVQKSDHFCPKCGSRIG